MLHPSLSAVLAMHESPVHIASAEPFSSVSLDRGCAGARENFKLVPTAAPRSNIKSQRLWEDQKLGTLGGSPRLVILEMPQEEVIGGAPILRITLFRVAGRCTTHAAQYPQVQTTVLLKHRALYGAHLVYLSDAWRSGFRKYFVSRDEGKEGHQGVQLEARSNMTLIRIPESMPTRASFVLTPLAQMKSSQALHQEDRTLSA